MKFSHFHSHNRCIFISCQQSFQTQQKHMDGVGEEGLFVFNRQPEQLPFGHVCGWRWEYPKPRSLFVERLIECQWQEEIQKKPIVPQNQEYWKQSRFRL